MNARDRIRVLAVDDNDANLRLACILLDDLGLDVTAAHSGEEAVELARKGAFDLVLMDLQMPGLGGREAARRIRALDAGLRRTPIIALTAHLLPEERLALREEGLDDEIVKPITDAQLRGILERWVAGDAAEEATRNTAAESGDHVVDWELGVRLAHGNRKLAEEMMTLLVSSLPRDAAAIMAAWNAHDQEQLRGAVHRLNGAIRYCGVPRLHRSVEQLESSIKRADQAAIGQALEIFRESTEDFRTWAECTRNRGR